MRANDFTIRLVAASFLATRFAASMVKDKLPFEFRYCVLLNSSHDGNREPDEIVYPEDENLFHENLQEEEVVELLCRDERVPQWIDIAVAYSTGKYSHLSLQCCGRYHSDDNRLYYYERGTQPFGIKSPNLPFPYNEGRRFRLPREREILSKFRKYCQDRAEAKQASGGK